MVKRRARKSSDLAALQALMSMRVQIWPPRLLGRRKAKPKRTPPARTQGTPVPSQAPQLPPQRPVQPPRLVETSPESMPTPPPAQPVPPRPVTPTVRPDPQAALALVPTPEPAPEVEPAPQPEPPPPPPEPKAAPKSKPKRKPAAKKKQQRRRRPRPRKSPDESVSLYHSLTLRIAILNILGLTIIVAGLLASNQFRTSLVDERVRSLEWHSRMISGVLERSALRPRLSGEAPYETIDMDMANNVLRRVVLPVNYRARIYDTNYGLIADSKLLAGEIPSRQIGPTASQKNEDTHIVKWLLNLLVNWTFESRLTPPPRPGAFEFPEVSAALRGAQEKRQLVGIRRNENDLLEVSVARPLKRLHAHVGVLLLTNEGKDFDRVAQADWKEILRVAAFAFVFNLVLAVFYAQTIVRPIRKLVRAANRIRTARDKPGSALAAEIPGFRGRGDEIGKLAASFNDMTKALTSRLDAIEKFAADVSHEIKNPLTSMRSAIETMDLAKTDEAKGRLMDVLKHDVDRLDRLITDISDASRLDAELSREAAAHVDIAKLLRDVAGVYNETMKIREAGPVKIAVRVDAGAGREDALAVSGLEGRLGQVLRNLIDNAISFSPPGGTVLLSAKYHGIDRDNAAIVITVEDEGPGIPEENLETIFRRFYTERPNADFGNNSGLGLSISKQIVEIHGGQIWAKNRRDSEGNVIGACFTVQLPASPWPTKRTGGRGDREKKS